jgi:hypothetical protein
VRLARLNPKGITKHDWIAGLSAMQAGLKKDIRCFRPRKLVNNDSLSHSIFQPNTVWEVDHSEVVALRKLSGFYLWSTANAEPRVENQPDVVRWIYLDHHGELLLLEYMITLVKKSSNPFRWRHKFQVGSLRVETIDMATAVSVMDAAYDLVWFAQNLDSIFRGEIGHLRGRAAGLQTGRELITLPFLQSISDAGYTLNHADLHSVIRFPVGGY